MPARIMSAVNIGVEAVKVDVECHFVGGLKRFTVVGLGDGVIREAKDRVRCALENSGFEFPRRDVVVSLSPASLPKCGSGLDLPIALSIIAAENESLSASCADVSALGELGLDGSVKPVANALHAALLLRKARGKKRLLLPRANADLASAVPGVTVFPVETLAEAVGLLAEGLPAEGAHIPCELPSSAGATAPLSEVIGQHSAKRALEIVAAGGHNLLLIGPPGAGKTMLAERLPSLLPPLEPEEMLEVTAIHSLIAQSSAATGNGRSHQQLVASRPVRAPHHSISTVALVGGGSTFSPGEISLAHRGILFLDELSEFRRDALESLRQPLESRSVTIHRAGYRVTAPASFTLVAATNPCPCGYWGSMEKACRCTPVALARHRSQISGPIFDRLDLQVWVTPVPGDQLHQTSPAAEDPAPHGRVLTALKVQQERFGARHARNGAMSPTDVQQHCVLPEEGRKLLLTTARKLRLSNRAQHRILRVARTIADLDASPEISIAHLAEALSYRIEQQAS